MKGKLGADTFFLGGLFWPPGNLGPTGQPEKAPPTEREGGSQSLKGGERGELVGRTGQGGYKGVVRGQEVYGVSLEPR